MNKKIILALAIAFVVFGVNLAQTNAQTLINELDINPAGTDQPCEYIELKGTPGAALTSLYFVAFEGDAIPSGTADYVYAFTAGQTIGSNGLLVITGSAACGTRTYPAATTRIQDPTLDASNGLENGTISFLLINSPNGAIVQGTDYDVDNSGDLELLPTGATVIDAVGFTDGGADDIVYGGVNLGTVGTSGNDAPDAATRFPGNTTPFSAAAFYFGNLTGTNDATTYSTTVSANFPTNGALTPGDVNVGVAVPVSKTRFDFDGDGKADAAVIRPGSPSQWYFRNTTAAMSGVSFGQTGDIAVPQDFDGDGKWDIAVFRSGVWYIQRSTGGFAGYTFGQSGDIPVPADLNGDGKAELVVFRAGIWYGYNISGNSFSTFTFGTTGDQPVIRDYDGDGKADYAVYRSGTWYIQRSTEGLIGYTFGLAGDKLVPADYDGDGRADVAVFRPSTGTWYTSPNAATNYGAIQFGNSSDVPVPADYDGDGKTDVAVFRAGTFYVRQTTAGATGFAFGAATDTPVENLYVR